MLRICALFVLALASGPTLAGVSGPIRVIDGDTIAVGDVTVRLHGIDAPEVDQTCTAQNGAEWRCGVAVSKEVRDRYQGAWAECDTQDTDRHGRVVAVCHVDGQDIGRLLVRDGLAFAFRRYSMAYDLDEKSAVIDGIGLHAGDVDRPADFRAGKRAAQLAAIAQQDAQAGDCKIKGNISSGGRIYHLPGQKNYARTSIRVEQGERFFCSEAEAKAAGWRPARR